MVSGLLGDLGVVYAFIIESLGIIFPLTLSIRSPSLPHLTSASTPRPSCMIKVAVRIYLILQLQPRP